MNKNTVVAAIIFAISSNSALLSARGLEEVVVTATKKGRAENLQTVPIAASVMTGDQVEAMFAENIADLGRQLPNVRLQSVGTFPGVTNFSIRGMGVASSIAGDEPTVGVILDGMYLGTNYGSDLDTFDIESIEVLRGPQGTLFGRNVTAGAVVVRSQRPTGEFGGKVKAGLGNNGRQNLSGTIQGALNDTVSAKVFANYKDRDGDWKNSTLNEDQGAQRTTFIRPSLLWTPSDNLDVTLIVERGDISGHGSTPNTSVILGQPTGIADDEVAGTDTGGVSIEWEQLVLEANWMLGDGVLTSITGYRDVDFGTPFADADGTPVEVFRNGVSVDQDQISQELRYASTAFDERMEYTLGIYYFQQTIEQRENRSVLGGLNVSNTDGRVDNESYAAFVNGTWFINDALSLTGGLRYTYEEKDVLIATGDGCNFDFTLCDYGTDEATDWNNLSPKLGINWELNDKTFLYASYARGFRSGGYNLRVASASVDPGPYDEETVDSFELGLKTDLLDSKARANVALFYAQYDDLQRVVLDPVSLLQSTRNAAAATVQGAEAEFTYRPLDALLVTAAVGYTDASYDEYNGLDVTGDGEPDPGLARNLKLVRAPEWTYALSASYDVDLRGSGYLNFRAAYSYTDEIPVNDINSFFHEDYGLFDASVSWYSESEALKVALWGKNLTDERRIETGAFVSIFSYEFLTEPRTYGVEISYQFD